GLPSEVRVTICSPSPGSPLGPWMLASLVHPMSHQPVDITGRDVEVEVSGLLIGEGAGHAGAGEPLRAAGPCRTLRTLCTFRASRSLRSLRTNLSLWAGGSLHALFALRSLRSLGADLALRALDVPRAEAGGVRQRDGQGSGAVHGRIGDADAVRAGCSLRTLRAAELDALAVGGERGARPDIEQAVGVDQVPLAGVPRGQATSRQSCVGGHGRADLDALAVLPLRACLVWILIGVQGKIIVCG